MKIKFLNSVLVLLAVLNVQTSWAQPNCVPSGSNATGTQLTYGEIGDDFDYTIDNNSRHNILQETLVLDQEDSDLQFTFDNPNGATLYVAMYLDLNRDKDFDYLTETIYEGQTNGTTYSDVLTLPETILNQLALGPKFLRVIVTTNYAAITNTCFFPGATDSYQATDIRTGRIKIKTTTAQIQTGTTGEGCQNEQDDFDSAILVTNEYEMDVHVTAVTIWYGREYTVCNGNYILGHTIPSGSVTAPSGNNSFYTWIPAGGLHHMAPREEFEIESVVAQSCWTPIEELDLKVTVYYNFSGGLVSAKNSYKEFDFPYVTICEGEDPIGGGGGFTNGNASPLELAPSISPNPSSGNTVLHFGLAKEAKVDVEIYNLLGQTVLIENANKYTAGQHYLSLATENLPVGTYLVNVKVDGAATTLTKMLIAR